MPLSLCWFCSHPVVFLTSNPYDHQTLIESEEFKQFRLKSRNSVAFPARGIARSSTLKAGYQHERAHNVQKLTPAVKFSSYATKDLPSTLCTTSGRARSVTKYLAVQILRQNLLSVVDESTRRFWGPDITSLTDSPGYLAWMRSPLKATSVVVEHVLAPAAPHHGCSRHLQLVLPLLFTAPQCHVWLFCVQWDLS